MDEPVEASVPEPLPCVPRSTCVSEMGTEFGVQLHMGNRAEPAHGSRWSRTKGNRRLYGGSPSRALVLAIVASSFWGCLSPIELNRTVIAYDAVANDTLARQLILNIARASNDEPLHFTGLSNIAATFNFQVSAGATPPLGGTEGGFILSPIFGTVWAENPTFSIVPIEGEEFTKRLLTPFPETILTLLLRQGADVDLVLRMMAGEYRTNEAGQKVSYYNKPSDMMGYAMFRRIVLQLSTVQDRNALFADPLIFDESWTMPAASLSPEALQSLVKDLSVSYEEKTHSYRITKRTIGRIIVTNYHPSVLSNDERMRLNDEAAENLEDELMIDIRPGYVGGEYPLHGKFRLRSFSNVIGFLGRAMSEDPEYDVAPDPRTPATSENPVFTLGMVEADSAPRGAGRVVKYGGHYYALRADEGYQWNKKAFYLLYQLFEMTVVKSAQGAAPLITISK
jgi:hypothetical protein